MATGHSSITPEQAALIREAKLFFVASTAPDLGEGPSGQGPVNLSPKGGTPLHIIDDNRVAYLDYTGSGNETARHANKGGPMTIMVMSMDGSDAAVVRLYGKAQVVPLEQSELKERLLSAPAEDIELPMRQVIDLTIESTQTSCGYGVPVYEYMAQRVRAQRGRRFKDS
ncbi:MAG TPA: pyridoxamine 5'-phosphate oxidase family protein [Dehalococcoidia bacterium]|nr:pyridoxamine 5'-phosphate oxidase family protein [Dehalococcoidia bacterium]